MGVRAAASADVGTKPWMWMRRVMSPRVNSTTMSLATGRRSGGHHDPPAVNRWDLNRGALLFG